MDWRYGLDKHERSFGTLVEWHDGFGFCRSDNFKDWFLLREKEIMCTSGPYFVPTDDISKPVNPGDVFECLVIESRQGLMGLAAKKSGCVETYNWDGIGTTSSWNDGVRIPRFIGVVKHWNFVKNYGFIGSDSVRTALYFHKKEVLVPIESLSDPYEAVNYKVDKGELVTFDPIETPRGMRAVAIQRWKGERNG